MKTATKSFTFKVRGVVQDVQLPFIEPMTAFKKERLRKKAKELFKDRGFERLTLNDVKPLF